MRNGSLITFVSVGVLLVPACALEPEGGGGVAPRGEESRPDGGDIGSTSQGLSIPVESVRGVCDYARRERFGKVVINGECRGYSGLRTVDEQTRTVGSSAEYRAACEDGLVCPGESCISARFTAQRFHPNSGACDPEDVLDYLGRDPDDLSPNDQRNTLISYLYARHPQSGSSLAYLQSLVTESVACLAATARYLETNGVRSSNRLRGMNLVDHRNTLIVEASERTGRSVPSLQAETNERSLYALRERFPAFPIVD